MDSEVDTSILNSVNIKRFTKAVLQEYGADVDQSNNAKWEVSFPPEIASRLDREQGTLVFDAADRERGAGELLVEPGTTVFSAFLELVQREGSVSHVELTEDTLQVTPPEVLKESDISIEVASFTERTSDLALTFHFEVAFETPASFHREEMYSVTVDPETGTRLPALTERLTAHLPQLLEQNNEQAPAQVCKSTVDAAYEEAQQAVVDQARPVVEELREEAEESTSERVSEISSWHAQRRSELDEQIEAQEAEVEKWQRKRGKARKDSTRREYISNRKQAERELEQLKQEIREKKNELDSKESAEVDEVIERNEVTVDVSLLGVTEVTYVRGGLSLNLATEHAKTNTELSYLPATDAFQGLDCNVCGRDLTEGVLPQLCSSGHVVGDPCATSCRSCGLTHCTSCDHEHGFAECEICWDSVCGSCDTQCERCHGSTCTDHHGVCTACGDVTCRLCGEDCATCEAFHCDDELTECGECSAYHCDAHIEPCGICNGMRCQDDLSACNTCGDTVCSDHSDACQSCGDFLCREHSNACELCVTDSSTPTSVFCESHTERCMVDDTAVCEMHRTSTTLGADTVCDTHLKSCSTCDIEYGTHNLEQSQCSACRSIGEVDTDAVPSSVVADFRSVEAGQNEAYMVVLAKKLLGRNRLYVYDVDSGVEVHQQSAGTLKQLLGAFR